MDKYKQEWKLKSEQRIWIWAMNFWKKWTTGRNLSLKIVAESLVASFSEERYIGSLTLGILLNLNDQKEHYWRLVKHKQSIKGTCMPLISAYFNILSPAGKCEVSGFYFGSRIRLCLNLLNLITTYSTCEYLWLW